MANITNPNHASLAVRVAAEKKQAADELHAKMRVASAWTLAKTMLPEAPSSIQLKYASNLLLNPSPVLFSMLRQAAVNAHYTHIAEEFKNVHKMDLNDLLEDPSVLSKAESAVTSELKGDAKNAAAHTADDRKENGEQPETYDEGKRTEPSDMDADGAADRPKVDTSKEAGKKTAGKKTACADGCKGGENCDHGKEKDIKKDAGKKTAEESETDAPVEGKTEDENPVAESSEEHEEVADEAAAEGTDDAYAGDTEGAGEAEGEVFDQEKATLQDAIEDVKEDIQVIQDAVEEEIGDAGEINLAEEALDDDAFAAAIEGEGDESLEGFEGLDADPNGDGGEELNLDGIFADDNLSDKVSALKDEGDNGFGDVEGMDGMDAFFAPTDKSELEGALDQEESLMSPVDMFAVEGVEDDPLARLFASKSASETEGVLKPGTLDSHFETELSGDDRNNDTDHDGDIFADVYDHLKQETMYGAPRDKQDAEPELKTPSDKTAGKKTAPKTQTQFPKLAQHFDPLAQATKIAGGNLASVLFTDEADYM